MRAIQELQKLWQDSARFRGLHASLSLEADGLVLGAKTVLAKRSPDGALALEGEEARLLTLLSVAHGRPVETRVLGNIRRASKQAQEGDEALAAMHIALAGLPALADPADAARGLFVADGLMTEGVSLHDIWACLDFDPAPLDELEKFNRDEPRNPKGDARASGEWTAAGAPSSMSADDAGARSASPTDLDTSMLQDAGARVYSNILAFVVRNGPAAQRLADRIPGLTSEEVLTALGCENEYGESPMARDYGNYGGIHYVPGKPYFPGQIGTFLTAGNPPGVNRQLMASFPPDNGFELSGQVLIDRIKPFVPKDGIASPEQFFALINAHGWGTTNAGYMNLTVGRNGSFWLVQAASIYATTHRNKEI